MPVRIASQAEPIPGYKLIERLGRGGFGEVWKAEAPGGLMKAIKFVYGDLEEKDGGAGGQELRALNRVKTVRHPFILSLERVDIIDGQLVIVMELADRNLADRFRECQGLKLPGVPREELLRYMEEAAEALDLMNTEYQLQHLDIKPQNLFLVRNHIKVADFGLVKDLEGMKASITGGVTPLYAAPETFEGWVSRYCDQYSLAIVYQELLTGQRPFDGTSARQLLRQHVEQAPDVSSLPVRDQEIIRRALAKKPSDRFPSCSYLVRLLRGVESGSETIPEVAAQPTKPAAPPAPSSVADSGLARTSDWRPQAEPDTRSLAPKPAALAPPSTLTIRPVAQDTNKAADPNEPGDTNHVAVQPAAPVEFKGPGVLFPATIIGIGQVGLSVLQRLREALQEQFRSMDALPTIRLLALDLDPEAMNAAARSRSGGGLTGREMLLVRLNRPGHFLKPREGAVAYQDFMDPEMLYRIPRNQLTGGLRCLGRLAFLDNYREIADRLRSELGACTETDAMAAADRQTSLGLRSNNPRVYIVASLAGGTGGGMFIDVAYLARFFLKQLGFTDPDVVGVFFLPRTHQQTKPLAVANTFAALTELYHFSCSGTTFSARYAPKEPPLTDAAPPFGRCLLMHLSRDDKGNQSLAALAAGFLQRDLLSPLGRAADTRRQALLQGAVPAPVLHTFGLNRLTWPRRTLIQQISRRLCLRIAQHWTNKETEQIQQAVEDWAREQWAKRNLQPDKLILSLKAACEGALDDKAPEDIFEAAAKEFAKKVPEGGIPDPAAVRSTLDELEKLVGKPEGDRPPPRTPLLVDGLEKAAKTLLTSCEQKLAEMSVHLVEQPRFRLVGAEEAIRNFNGFLQQAIQQQEPLCEEFTKKANETYARIASLTEGLKAAAIRRKPNTLAADLTELLRIYPMLRLRALILQRVLTILRSLRGNCPEYLREFGYCRTRLLDLVKAFETGVETHAALNLGPARELFPAGCYTVEDTVNKFLGEVTGEELFELDQRVQTILKTRFTALVHVCTTAANLLKDLEPAMQQEMETFVTGRLGATNAVESFLAQHPDESKAHAELMAAHKEAAPRLAVEPSAPSTEMSLVIVPIEQAATEFRRLVQAALPAAEVTAGAKNDDVVFYRETPALGFADLSQTGVEARKAYQQMLAAEHFTPHSRSDVTDWRLPPQR